MSGTIGIMCTTLNKGNNNQQVPIAINTELVDVTETSCVLKYSSSPNFDINLLDVFVELNDQFYTNIKVDKGQKTVTLNGLTEGSDYSIALLFNHKDNVYKSKTFKINASQFTLLAGSDVCTKLKSLPEISKVKSINFLDYNNDFVREPSDIDLSITKDNKIVGRIENGNLNIIATQPYYMFSASDMFSNFNGSLFEFKNISFAGIKAKGIVPMDSLFYNCSSLEQVDFGKNIIPTNDIHNMFRGCTYLASVDLSMLETSNMTRMDYMFRRCHSLTSINISNLNVKNVVNAEGVFDNCIRLTEVFLPTFTPSLNHTSQMFDKCKKLTSIDTSVFKDSKILLAVQMFNGCESLVSLDLSMVNTNYITDASYFVSNCTSLTSLKFSNITNFRRLSKADYMFWNCSSLTELDVSTFNTANLTTLNRTFCDLVSLRRLIGIENFNTSSLTNMERAFTNDHVLEYLNLSKWDLSKVTNFIRPFTSCYNLSGEITINGTACTNHELMFGDCSTEPNSRFVVKYIDEPTKALATQMVATKTVGSNIVLYEEASLLTGPTFSTNIKAMPSFANVKTINFKYENPAAASTYENIDVSLNQDRSIVAYINGTELNVVSEKEIQANDLAANEMFSGLTTITAINFDNFRTDNVTDMSSMFDSCESLTSLDLSNFNTSSVTDMSSMFYYCPSLTTLDLSNFNTSSVTDMSSMFSHCESLTSGITLSCANTATHTDMFLNCSTDPNAKFTVKYESPTTKETALAMIATKTVGSNVVLLEEASLLTGPTFSTNIKAMPSFANVKTINFKYENPAVASTYENIDVSLNQDRSIVAYINGTELNVVSEKEIQANLNMYTNGMFLDLTAITAINFDNFNTSKVTNMGCMFYGCSSLTSLDLSNFNTSNVTNMWNMFNNCSSLTSLDLSSFNTSKVTDMNYMFRGCSSLTSLDLSNFNTSSVTNMNGMFYNCSSLTSLDLSNFNTSSVTTMEEMFDCCKKLVDLNVSHFNTSNVDNMNYLFRYCSSLTLLDVSNFNTSKVTSMKSMFSFCSSLTLLDVSNFNTSNVTNMCFMFYKCSSLMSLDVSNFNTSSVTTMESMFSFCSSLTSLDVSNFNTSNVTTFKEMFDYCSSLTSLDLSNFNTSSVTTMEEMFDYCKKLVDLNISSFDTSKVTSMKRMFRNCYVLPELNVSHFNTSNVTTFKEMFDDCKKLTSLDLSGWDFSSAANMSQMFYNCINLTSSITLNCPNLISYSRIFDDCSTQKEASFIVNYSEAISKELAVDIVNTKTSYSQVFLNTSTILTNGTLFNDKIKAMSSFPSVRKILFKKRIPTNINSYENIDVSLRQDKSIIAYINGSELIIASDLDIELNSCSGGMFTRFKNITDITFDNINTNSLYESAKMFYLCDKLVNITGLNRFNTTGLVDMHWMFSNCKSLTSLDLSSFNTSKVTNMSYLFNSCEKLTTINNNNLDASSVVDFSHAFNWCCKLNGEISIKNINITPEKYSNVFRFTSCYGTGFYVNYISTTKDLAQQMVNTQNSPAKVFLGKEVQNKEVITYGIYIDENERTPSNGSSYLEQSSAFTRAGKKYLGVWGNKWPYKDIRVVKFKNGSVTGEIDKNFLNNCTLASADVDIMIEIPKFYWKVNSSKNGYEIRISNVKQEGFDCYAHKVNGVEKDFIYVGRYLGYIENGKLRSKSGVAPTTNTSLTQFRTAAHNVGTGYQQMNWYTLTAIRILYLLAYGNRDSQQEFGQGAVKTTKTNTGGTDTKGFMYGTTANNTEQISLFGIEDAWGNLLQFVDGIYCGTNNRLLVTKNNADFNDTGSGFEDLGTTPIIYGYLTKVNHNNKSLFFPTTAGGAIHAYYSDWCNVQSGKFGTCGGFYNDGESPGMFLFNMDSAPSRTDSNLGSRLVYLG